MSKSEKKRKENMKKTGRKAKQSKEQLIEWNIQEIVLIHPKSISTLILCIKMMKVDDVSTIKFDAWVHVWENDTCMMAFDCNPSQLAKGRERYIDENCIMTL